MERGISGVLCTDGEAVREFSDSAKHLAFIKRINVSLSPFDRYVSLRMHYVSVF